MGGSYRGLAMHGSGGRGALITGTLAVKENDVLKFVLAGGGAYNRDKPTEPGKGWANGGSHGPSYKTTDARTVKFFEGPNTAEEYYGPTGGGASAVFLNDKLIAVAGGGGGAGTRFYSYTVWNDMQSGPQPKEFLPLILETTEAAQGSSGGAGNGANGSSFSEIYKFFPGPSIRANGGLAGENGKGGGGAGARQISRTSWNKEFYGPQPESFKGLKFNTVDIASGGSGGRVGERGGSYQETYLFFPGPALNMNGGLGGGNGQGGAGAPAGSLSDPKSNSAISFEGSQERYLFSQNVAGNAGADATLTKNSQGNNGGQGGAGVVGIGMAITWYRTSDLNQCSILHGSTGGGGYGGGGSASVTTAAGYGADHSYASVTGWVDGNYIEGDTGHQLARRRSPAQVAVEGPTSIPLASMTPI